MLNKVEVRNAQGMMLSLPLKDFSAGYKVQEITGLDPVNASIVSSEFALMDGARYQSSRRETRNLVFTLGLSPDYITGTVRELRSKLYSYFMPKSKVNLRFYTNGAPTVNISGYVESFENALFSKEPEAVLSLLCLDPDFVSIDPVIVSGSTVSDLTVMSIDYAGTIETGFIFRMTADRVIDDFTIYNTHSDSSLRSFEFIAPLASGDVVEINTSSGSKGALLTRAGIGSSILYGVSSLSSWLKLYSGLNGIRVSAAGAAVPYSIEYTDKFGGL